MDQEASQQDASDTLGQIESAVVHAKHSHGLKISLYREKGEATLLVLPYTNMAAGHVVVVTWDSPVEGASLTLEHTVAREEVDALLLFSLDREILKKSLDQVVSVSYTVIINGRERESDVQEMKIVDQYPDPPEYLAPLTLDGMPPDEVHPQPGGVSLYVQYDDMQTGDGVVLYVVSPSHRFELWHEVKNEDLEDGFTFTLEESFLKENLDKRIELLYAFARPGTALSAQPLILDVTEEEVVEPPEPVVHVKEAIGLTLYLKDFRGDWHVTVLPSYSMAEQDRLILYLRTVVGNVPISKPLVHDVTAEEVGSPLTFTIPRAHLVTDTQVDVYYSVMPKEGNERHSEHQQFSVLDAKSNPADHLPVPTVEGAVDNAIYPTPAKVTVPAASGMALDDKVVLYVEGLEQTPPQWLSVHDTEADLEFELDVEQLAFNAGEFIKLSYQFARQGMAFSSKILTLDILHFPDAVQKSLVHIRESHDLTVALSTFVGDATLSVLPYWGMAKGDEISVVAKQEGTLEPSVLTHVVVGDDDIGSVITFMLDRKLLEAAVGKQVEVHYTVTSKGTEQLAYSIAQSFSIREEESEVPPRLPKPEVEGEQDGALDPLPSGAQVFITVGPEIKAGDELILHAQSAWSIAPFALRVTDDHVKAGKVDFLLPGEWLIRNASWQLTLLYQVSRAGYGLSGEPLRLRILEQSGAQESGRVVHIRQAHDRNVDLQTFKGDATLVVLPYVNMVAKQKIQIYWADENLQEPTLAAEHVLTQEDVDQTLELALPRQLLEEALGGDAHRLYYRVWFNERPIDSSIQDILVSSAVPGTPLLPPIPGAFLHPTPGGTTIEVPLPEGTRLEDGFILYTDGIQHGRPQGHIVTQDVLDKKRVLLHLSEPFLEANLGKKVGLECQYGRPGAALSSEKSQLTVTQKPDLLPGHVVHFKQAHGLTVVLADFEGDGDLVVLPYPDMHAEQTITVYWSPIERTALSSHATLTYVVKPADVDNPIAFKLPRSYLQPTPPATAFRASVYFTVHTGTGEPRIGDRQKMAIALTPPAELPARLPAATVEGAQGNKLELDLEGAKVTVPKYEGMAFDDEVLFYIDGDKPVPVQWQRVEDTTAKALEFQLSYALLKDHVGTFLDLNYQFGRPGQALSGKMQRLHIAWRAGAIAQSLVHCKQSHSLTIDMSKMGDDALLTILPYLGMAANDKVIAYWTPYKNGVPLPSFPLAFIVLEDDLGIPITLALHREEVAKALGSTGRLHFEVTQGDTETPVRSSEQEFKVVDGVSSPPPRLAVPDVEGSVNGELMPDANGVKATMVAYSSMVKDDQLVLHLDGAKPVAPLTLRIEQRHVDARKVEFLLPGNWLLHNAEATISLEYQYARKGYSLSSEPLSLKLLKPETPIVPGPVVHFGQAQGLTVALQGFEGEGTLHVMPHDEILDNDSVTVRWQRHLNGEPIEEARRMEKTGSSTQLLTFLVDRAWLEEAVGYTVKLDYTVTGDGEAKPKFTSRAQRFRISYYAPPPADPLPQPTVEGAVDGALYPVKGEVTVTVPAYAGMLEEDEVLLQASGVTDEIHWVRVKNVQPYLQFKLSEDFITKQEGKAFSLHYTCARSGLALTARKLTLEVLQQLVLPKPIFQEASNDKVEPENIRAGGTFSLTVPEVAGAGLIQLRLLYKQVVVFESAAQRIADNKDILFYVPAEVLAPLTGKDVSATYLFTNLAGRWLQSAETSITFNPLNKEHLPWLQCDNACGRTELAKVRVGEGPLWFSLAGWPFMAAGQNVRITADALSAETGKREEFLLCNRPVTSTEEAKWLFKCSVRNDVFLDKVKPNERIAFKANLSLDAQETEISLTPIDLFYRGN